MIVAGATAYPRIIDFPKMAEVAKEVGAMLMVDIAHIAGLVATGFHPSPVPYAEVVTSTTHKTLRGPRGGFILTRNEFAPQIDKAVFPGNQGGPLMHVIAAKAVAFQEASLPEFKIYQHQVVKNAKTLGETLTSEGIRLVSGGTDNHLLLLDLRGQKLTGKIAEKLLDEVGITANKNAIPFDPEKPFVTSGIRLGTPALTTRGLRETEMKVIGQVIGRTLKNLDDTAEKTRSAGILREICERFPLYMEGAVSAGREGTRAR